jgi:hypothetical protein
VQPTEIGVHDRLNHPKAQIPLPRARAQMHPMLRFPFLPSPEDLTTHEREEARWHPEKETLWPRPAPPR